jgi:class 3 adenylate cyclase
VKGLGDGLMVVFDSALAALSCGAGCSRAVEHHNRSADEPLAIRVGVATGEPTSTGGDYFGEPVVISAPVRIGRRRTDPRH